MRDQQLPTPSFPQAPLENGQAQRLKTDVSHLATEIGPRNIQHYEALQKAAAHIETSLKEAGYCPLLHHYEASCKTFANISAEVPGRDRDDEIVVIGAHMTRTRTHRARMTMVRPLPPF